MRSRFLSLTAAVLALSVAVGAAGAWWWVSKGGPASRPTAFGWPADLTTAAGAGARGSVDGPAANARFSDPFAIAVDHKGRVFVADAGTSGAIRRLDADGSVHTLPGRFQTPSGVAVDGAGAVYVADTAANAVFRIDPDGKVVRLAGDGTAGRRDGPGAQARFDGPMGLAVDGAGTVYVADAYNDAIRAIGKDGVVRTLAGGERTGFADGKGASAVFDTPCGVAIDASGAVLAADTGNDAIRKIAADGTVSTLARTADDDRTGVLRSPIGLAATRDGYLYVATFRRGRIVELSPKGEVLALNGRRAANGNEGLRLAAPAGVALDSDGGLYVADAGAYAIRKLSPRRSGAPVVNQEIAVAAPEFAKARAFPWPVAPQTAWHEVVGGMGEVRGDYRGEPRDHLHAGLDVHAEVGERVLAVADETVESPIPNWDPEGLSEGLRVDQMTYIHMRVGRSASGAPLDAGRFQMIRDAAGKLVAVRVRRGTRFKVGDALGTVNRMAHVHLELGPSDSQINPMSLKFVGLADHAPPRIESITVTDAAGRRLTERQGGRLVVARGAGPLNIVVDAWDQVDGDQARRRLGLYRAGYQVLKSDGTPAKGYEQPVVNLEFNRMPRDRDAVKTAYAPDSGDTVHGAKATRFLYVVTNRVRDGKAETGGWRPADLAPGDYVVRILAEDYAGNAATERRDLAITVK